MYRYCLVVAMLLFVEPGQVVESAADAEIIRPACLFEDRNHAFALYLGVAIAVRDRIDAREIVERQGQVRMFTAQDGFADSQAALCTVHRLKREMTAGD